MSVLTSYIAFGVYLSCQILKKDLSTNVISEEGLKSLLRLISIKCTTTDITAICALQLTVIRVRVFEPISMLIINR